jgi:hypothetical protein
MRVGGAKQVAGRWVAEVAAELPGFQGAFFHGSINWMAEDDPFPATSDVDVGVVFADSGVLPKLGKLRREGVLVEGAAIARERLATAELLLGDNSLGHSFRTNSVIADPTGHLARVQREVGLHFGERRWILARCEVSFGEEPASGLNRVGSGLVEHRHDISESARPVAIDGSRALIERGEHREAMFWVAVTYARCMAVLETDAPREVAEAFEPGLRDMLRDLGVETFQDMRRRTAEIEAFLPALMASAGDLF